MRTERILIISGWLLLIIDWTLLFLGEKRSYLFGLGAIALFIISLFITVYGGNKKSTSVMNDEIDDCEEIDDNLTTHKKRW